MAGDANCDGEVTAADVPFLLTLIETGDPAPCGGADADGNGTVDENDLSAMIDALFDTAPAQQAQ